MRAFHSKRLSSLHLSSLVTALMFYYYQCGIIYFSIVRVMYMEKPCITKQTEVGFEVFASALSSFKTVLSAFPTLTVTAALWARSSHLLSSVSTPSPSCVAARTAQHGLFLPKKTKNKRICGALTCTAGLSLDRNIFLSFC